MQTKEFRTSGGLNGRARKARRRNRVTRFYQDEMVAEFFNDSEKSDKPQRQIPIRHKNEFLPSAHGVDPLTVQTSRQMELPLEFKKYMYTHKTSAELIPHRQVIKFMKIHKTQSAAKSSRLRKLKDAKAWQPVHLSPRILTNRSSWRLRVGSLSLGGFAYGCLLGGAAAAFMLMLINIVMVKTL